MERNGMLYTVDEWRETECFTPLMNEEKQDAIHHFWKKRNGMLYIIDEWSEMGCFSPLMNGDKRNALHHWWMERNGMLKREGSPYHACSDRNAFFTSEKPKKYHAWSCQNVCDALTFLLDNIFIRFGTKLYRQVVGIPMGTNCAPLVADLFLFCYERDFMMSLSDDKQADVIDAFNTTSRYLDDILNINNVYFDNMVSQIYPSELQLNKANASDTEAAFLDLHLSISNDIVSTKIYDKRDDFDFEIVNFPFLDGDVPRSTSYGVYISQLIRFARASSYVVDFNTRNKLLTQKLLKQGYQYHKLRKTFSKFYRRYYDLISKFQVGL